VRNKYVHLYTPDAATLLSSKRVLAWLYQDLPLLSAHHQSLIKNYVPLTYFLTDQRRQRTEFDHVLRERERYVLKPAHGHGGHGVMFGSHVDGADWRRAVDEHREEFGGALVQRRVHVDPVQMPFFDATTSENVVINVEYVLGQYMFDGEPAGMLVRHPSPSRRDFSGPINLRSGSGVPNTALFFDPAAWQSRG
jgi:hypothetical protein